VCWRWLKISSDVGTSNHDPRKSHCGATGALITVKAPYELQRINGRFVLVTMCIGGGQGIAAIFENLQ
jgi:hypothetical protein